MSSFVQYVQHLKYLSLSIPVLFVCISTGLHAQTVPIDYGYDRSNTDVLSCTSTSSLNGLGTAASTWYDVTYYRLALTINIQSTSIRGNVAVSGICRDSARVLTLDLVHTMVIDSILIQGRKVQYHQSIDWFDITLPRLFTSGERLAVDVYYRGNPVSTGFGSFRFVSHAGIPWVHSLSEPFGAKDWWPCKNDPGDKADSADILITCDSTYSVGSEGRLTSVVNNKDGTATYYWKERYPIASYLISVALTNYNHFSNWFRYSPTDSMEVLNYVLPEHDSSARASLPKVVTMLSVFSNLFGLYPFIREKYGHAEISGGSSMEHQTMTSLTTFNEDVISHELAHQWFGDMITCRTWSDLWLNEGFAQYCSALYRERQYGATSYWTYMNGQFSQAKLASGEVGVADTTSPGALFNSARVYSKGATILHMLRHVLGDSAFFQAMYAYANNPSLKYGTAASRDFQTVCETVAGNSLGYFFQEWLYGDKFPSYLYSWNWKSTGSSGALYLTIAQTTIGNSPAYYSMPLDVRLTVSGKDTTIVVFNNAQVQTFTIPCPAKPTSVLLDPDGWVLKYSSSSVDEPPSTFSLEQNYPNPFNSSTMISYQLPTREQVSLKVYDIMGRIVATLVDAKQFAGVYEVSWNSSGFASGIYFYRVIAGNYRMQRKMLLLK